jgi:hypothetical protein
MRNSDCRATLTCGTVPLAGGSVTGASDASGGRAAGDGAITSNDMGQDWAHELSAYKSVADYLWQTEAAYGWFDDASQRGIY